MKKGKKYIEKAKLINRESLLNPNQAFALAKETSYASFDESVEVHFRLGIDPRHSDQQLRGTLVLPNGTGKTTRVAVITQGENEAAAKKAGADDVGGEDLVAKIKGGWFDFDILIASPDMMSKVGQLGKVLGAKGLMPNPKSGTVTPDIENAVKEFKAGKIEYRNDKYGIIHLSIGKKSFEKEMLIKNFELVYNTLHKIKPAKTKGTYIKSISVSTSMGPGIFIDPSDVRWDK
ncbi:50S ribosomal protein L1 [Candidatus Marinamargulisbacteria bacterium SCGC AAA071-K20]|nr:50S ribosomal protein L1 [Candidatus Marinamargulisbacteria bacterium SCGC AAA071-K20]